MKRTRSFFVLASLLVGCGANATGAPGSSSDDSAPVSKGSAATAAPGTEAHQGTLLATASKDGRTVSFYELSPGTVVVEQSGPAGTKPLEEVNGASTFVDAYRAVAQTQEVPAALSAALDRFHAARVVASDVPEPPAVIAPRNTPDQNWFQQNFCTDRSTAYCVFSNSGGTSVPWSQANGYTEIALDDVSDETSLVMLDYLWENVGGTWQWVNDFRAPPVAPNTWESERFFNASMVYRYASVGGGSGPGGVAPVGLTSEVRNAYFSAVWAGQWQFSGGYFVNDSVVQISVTNPLLGESPTSTQAIVSGGSFSTLMPVWCANYPGTAPINFKAVGMQTGETAYASAPENGCW